MFKKLQDRGFEVLALHHAEAILTHDMQQAMSDIEDILLQVQIPVEELVRGGGGEGQLTQRLRNALSEIGWKKPIFLNYVCMVLRLHEGLHALCKSHPKALGLGLIGRFPLLSSFLEKRILFKSPQILSKWLFSMLDPASIERQAVKVGSMEGD